MNGLDRQRTGVSELAAAGAMQPMQPMEPMQPAGGNAPGDAALGRREFYRAYRAFATTLLRPDSTLRFNLEPAPSCCTRRRRAQRSRARCRRAGCGANGGS